MPQPPWIEYKVGRPSKGANWINPDGTPVSTVAHIAHLTDTVRIVEDRMIRASLIWDESCLRETRTRVIWVSPNYWGQSSYGNVDCNCPNLTATDKKKAGRRVFTWLSGLLRTSLDFVKR